MTFIPTKTTSSKKRTTSAKGKSKDPSDKPKRPLSAYNLFFRHARAQILKNASQPTYKPRRSHGKIGFADLARSVAEKWKSLDAESKAEFEAKAATEKERYEGELEIWNQQRVEKIASFYHQQQKSDPISETLSGNTMPFGGIFFAPLETTPSMPMLTRNVSFSSVSSSGSVMDQEYSNANFASHSTNDELHQSRNSQFSFMDCTPLAASTNPTLDSLVSGFDDECFNILSALKQD